MNKLFYYLSASVILSIAFAQPIQAQNQSIEGNWLGALDVGGGTQLRLVLKISKSGDALAA